MASRVASLSALLLVSAAAASGASPVAVPNARQLEFMGLELTQFMHFGIPTFWDPPEDYLYGKNPTYHDCHTTSIDHGPQTEGFYPCLKPDVFNPTDLNAENWMAASASLGMREIIITAHHEGGFALWPSKFTPYSVAASKWKGGKGDVLREFADAANRWGIKISYYLNVQDDGYMTSVAKFSSAEFIRRQVGMVTEVLTEYGPVNRFWFDGTKSVPNGTNITDLWQQIYDTIRKVSPATMITSYRGDVCSAKDGATLYTNDGPAPNSTDPSSCQPNAEGGKYFHPTEMHGITIQEGPDGNSDAMPTYWFWHPWACAFNVTGCPWVGHANASRIFDSYIVTVGRGATLNMNIPPERTGQMNASVVQVMAEAGKAINDTFHKSVVATQAVTGKCAEGFAELTLPSTNAEFDYIVSMEDLAFGQRFGNYSIEFQRAGGSGAWEPLTAPTNATATQGSSTDAAAGLQDRPDGHDPRDSHIGHKRIDLPIVPTSGPDAIKIAKVRLSCRRAIAEPVYLASFSLHKRTVPWEQ